MPGSATPWPVIPPSSSRSLRWPVRTAGRPSRSSCGPSSRRTARSFGYVGPLGWFDGARAYPPSPGEPAAEVLAPMLAAMVERRCTGAIVELSPGALAQRRDEALEPLHAAIVTALPAVAPDDAKSLACRRDHARLLRRLAPGGAVVLNADDREADLLSTVRLDARRLAFGLARPGDVWGTTEPDGPFEQRLTLRGPDGRRLPVRLGIPGRRVASCALAAAALAWSRDVPDEVIRRGLEAVAQIPGHLESVREGQSFGVWITAAPTPADLAEDLETLRSLYVGRLHCLLTVPESAPVDARLVAACERLADRVILIGREPDDAWLGAFHDPGRVLVESDRVHAIERAMADAADDDAVLIVSDCRPRIEPRAHRILVWDDPTLATHGLRQSRQARSPRRRTA